MKINFNNRAFTNKYRNYIEDILNKALDVINPNCRDLEINFAFVSKKEIHKLNLNNRGVDRVTDVLSFPNLTSLDDVIIKPEDLTKENYIMDVNPESNNIILGDIYLCLPVCKKQAKEYNTGIIREITYLTLHSFLHLLGYDHIEEKDRVIMRDLEKKIID